MEQDRDYSRRRCQQNIQVSQPVSRIGKRSFELAEGRCQEEEN